MSKVERITVFWMLISHVSDVGFGVGVGVPGNDPVKVAARVSDISNL